MYIIVDDRESVANSYVGGLVREGVSSIGFSSGEFWDWLQSASESDLAAVDAFLLGDCDARASLPLFKEVAAAMDDKRAAAKAAQIYDRVAQEMAAQEAALDHLQGRSHAEGQ